VDEVKDKVSKKPRKFLLIGGSTLLAVFVLVAVANFVWLRSGSTEWKFVEERNGIKLWTQKTPGNPLLKGRAKFRVSSNLGGIVKIVYDLNVHKANNMMKVTFMESEKSPGYYSVFNTFTQDMPFPFKKREFVLLSQHFQNPETKAIELNAMAAPNKIPPSDCCVRLVHLHNRYTLTPVGNNDVDIEFFWDIDLGGAFPYLLANAALPDTLYKAMDDFRNLIAKYHNDKVDYIAEPVTTSVSAQNLSLPAR
jgi:hypothetical protein